MHADIHAQADMSVLKKYGKKRPDRDVPRIYVLGRNDPEPNCSLQILCNQSIWHMRSS